MKKDTPSTEVLQSCDMSSSCTIRRLLPYLLAIAGTIFYLTARAPQRLDDISRSGSVSSPIFLCPTSDDNRVDGANPDEASYYDSQNSELKHNLHKYATTFRTKPYDAWGHSYNHNKEQLKDWKLKHYVDAVSIEGGASIYESAMGIGLNLLLASEVLLDDQEERKIQNITLYGNEYMADSVGFARDLFHTEHIFPPAVHYGQFCQGDSRNLSFVPANAFDLVYSGYITPLQNPLDYVETSDKKGSKKKSAKKPAWRQHLVEEVCPGETDAQLKEIHRMQKLQDDWYSSWVVEMIRIAKPGVPVIVEEVAWPLCVTRHDWGGVSHDFWRSGVARYGWDIDPASIVFENHTVSSTKRYHVFMRKRV